MISDIIISASALAMFAFIMRDYINRIYDRIYISVLQTFCMIAIGYMAMIVFIMVWYLGNAIGSVLFG